MLLEVLSVRVDDRCGVQDVLHVVLSDGDDMPLTLVVDSYVSVSEDRMVDDVRIRVHVNEVEVGHWSVPSTISAAHVKPALMIAR